MREQRGAAASRGTAGRASSGLLYLYAILPEGSPAEQLLLERRIAGVHPDGRLFGLRSAGLVAAVSEVPPEMFREEALNALLQDVSEVGPYALRHNEAIRALMPGASALIPLAFGTVYVTAQGVSDLLQGNAEAFHKTLQALAGKREWTVKVFLDAEALAQAAAKSSEEARRLQEEGASATPGRAYMLRKRREEALTREATTLQRKTLEGVLGALQAQAGAVHVDSLPTHEPSSVRLALKVSALVAVDRQDAFHAAVQAAQGSYEGVGIRLEVTGPWPAYSFVGDRHERP